MWVYTPALPDINHHMLAVRLVVSWGCLVIWGQNCQNWRADHTDYSTIDSSSKVANGCSCYNQFQLGFIK